MTVIFFGGAVFGEVEELFLVAGAAFGEVQVLLFVASALFAEIWNYCRGAKCCIFQYKMVRLWSSAVHCQ